MDMEFVGDIVVTITVREVLMLARRYGYWISTDMAADHPDTAPHVDGYTPPGLLWKAIVAVVVGFVGLGASTDGFANDDLTFGAFVSIAIGFIGVMLIAMIWTGDRSDRRTRELLQRHPWQAWPVHMDRRYRLDLLDPDQRVVKTVVGSSTPISDQIFERLPDGIGVVWVCGDLRETIVIAPVGGGKPLCLAKTRPPSTFNVSDEFKKAAIAAAVQAAGTVAMSLFLGLGK